MPNSFRFLSTFSAPVAAAVTRMSPADRRSLIEFCISRVPENLKSQSDVELALRTFATRQRCDPNFVVALGKRSESFFGQSIEADEGGHEALSVYCDQVAAVLAALCDALRTQNLAPNDVDSCLYYLTGAMAGNPKSELEAFVESTPQ